MTTGATKAAERIYNEVVVTKRRSEAIADMAAIIDKETGELLEALKMAHEAIDRLFAMIIDETPCFLPTKSGQPWSAMVAVTAAIARAKGEKE